MPLKLKGSTSGDITVSAPAIAGTNTATFPATTGVIGLNNSGYAGPTGASTDDLFYENSKAVTANYTITGNKCAMSTGPITINSGVTVTIPTGARWVIL